MPLYLRIYCFLWPAFFVFFLLVLLPQWKVSEVEQAKRNLNSRRCSWQCSPVSLGLLRSLGDEHTWMLHPAHTTLAYTDKLGLKHLCPGLAVWTWIMFIVWSRVSVTQKHHGLLIEHRCQHVLPSHLNRIQLVSLGLSVLGWLSWRITICGIDLSCVQNLSSESWLEMRTAFLTISSNIF